MRKGIVMGQTLTQDKRAEILARTAAVKDANIPCGVQPQAVLGLIQRLAGETYAQRFRIEELAAARCGQDRFRIEDAPDGQCIRIAATSGVAAAAAFNWYLQNRCRSYIGPLTKRMELPATPPAVGTPYEGNSPFLYRYFLNYCTFGYTFSFWKWEDWEPFLDWAMLSGYNLVLNPIGHEMVWLRLLTKNGYTHEEARQFLCGPSFFPWQCMMNLMSWGGPAPDSWLEERVELARKINDRLQSFGAAVMLPGFSGMVPADFVEHFPDAHPMDQGNWCQMKRPALLMPDDPYFDRIATDFYREQMALYGDNFHYFSTDPFHEGGDASQIDTVAYARGCYEKMTIASPRAVWFFQGWQSNPRREILNALPEGRTLVGNLRAEDRADGGDNFGNHPWLYCCVNNFGGQRVTRGNIHKLLVEPHQMVRDKQYTMVGIGSIPEGVENDEILFDILMALSFQEQAPQEDIWLRDLVQKRYGAVPDDVYDAWKILKDEVYLADTSATPRESSLCCRPSLTADMVSTYSCAQFNYQPAALEKACRLLFLAFDSLQDCQPYRSDLTDFVRQTAANRGWSYVEGIQKSYQAKDLAAFERYAAELLSLYPLQDQLMATDPHAQLGCWLEKAKANGHTDPERAFFENQARLLITLWGDRAGASELRDYAAREWHGMLMDFYRPRWEAYINLLRVSFVTGREIAEYSRYDADYAFTLLGGSYPTEPSGDLRAAVSAMLNRLAQ